MDEVPDYYHTGHAGCDICLQRVGKSDGKFLHCKICREDFCINCIKFSQENMRAFKE